MTAKVPDWVVGTLVVGAGLVIGLVLLVGLAAGIRTWAHHYATGQCERWETETGYDTRMADFTWWDFKCVAQDAEGRWLPVGQLRDID